MSKLGTSVLVLALLASTGVAAAQEGGYRPEMRRSWKNTDRPETAPETRPAREPREAPAARQAAPAPEAPRARDGGERRGGGDHGPRPDGERRDWNRGDRGSRGGDQARPPAPAVVQPTPEQRRDWNRDGRRPDSHRDERRDRDWNNDRRDDRRDGRDWNRDRNDGRDWNDGRRWDDARRHQQRPRYDRRHYQPDWRSQQRYRGWAYQAPRGFYARSWMFGDLLPRSWWEPQYRIDDWWAYGLPVPPIGYEWVRVGDDALLVDMFSGRVVQVARNLFW